MDVLDMNFRPLRVNGNGQPQLCNGCNGRIERGSGVYVGHRGDVYHSLVDCVLSSEKDTMATVAEGTYV